MTDAVPLADAEGGRRSTLRLGVALAVVLAATKVVHVEPLSGFRRSDALGNIRSLLRPAAQTAAAPDLTRTS